MTPTKTPPFAESHPILARLGNWPLICVSVSAIFLMTVYLLGNFGHPGNRQDDSSSDSLRHKIEASPSNPIQAAAVR